MEAQGPQGTPPGWYPNPQGPGQRFWDGTKWTDSYSQQQHQPPQHQPPPQPQHQPPQKSGGVKLGTTRDAVGSKFGPPKSDQESANEGLGDDSCIYYNLKGCQLLDQWQFCFGGAGQSGKLRSKNRL